MEKRRMFVLVGKPKTGKSTTINLVRHELKKHATGRTPVKYGNSRKQGRQEILFATMTINGVKVGITSKGDSPKEINKYVKLLIDAKCAVIVCAMRPEGTESAKALHLLADNETPKYKFFPIAKEDGLTEDESDEKTCQVIVDSVLEAVGLAESTKS